MKVSEIARELESWSPLALEEEYDNSGLLCGDPAAEVNTIMVSLDLTEEVLNEAIDKGCSMILSHHPFIFKPIKRVIAGTSTYRILAKALKHEVALYAMHTNVDNSFTGLNSFLARKLNLDQVSILQPKTGLLLKLVTFCPSGHADQVRLALFEAGAGHIGNYDQCSYNLTGLGSFRGSDDANPFVGEKNKIHFEEEIRIEVILPGYIEKKVVEALKQSHPYEEVAYDLYPLVNKFDRAGSGVVGNLKESMDPDHFLGWIRESLMIPALRHTTSPGKRIKRVALCSGSGSFLLPDAIHSGADAFLTADLKYHDFQDARNHILMADIGHYESEVWVKELFRDVLIEKFPNFAVLISEREENPVRYLLKK